MENQIPLDSTVSGRNWASFPAPPTHVMTKPLVPSRPSRSSRTGLMRAPLGQIETSHRLNHPNPPTTFVSTSPGSNAGLAAPPPCQMKKPHQTFSIFEDRSRDGFSSIGDRLSRFSKTSSTKTVPNRPPANADLSIKSSALPFQIHMDSSSPSNQSIRQSSSRNPFEERTDEENHEESNCPLKKSFMIVTDQAQPIWNSNITSLPRIHPVPSAECQSLPREPLKPIRSVNLSRLEGTDYSSGPDDEAARCEIDSAMDISTFSNAMIMDEPVDDRDQVYAGEDDLDVEDVDASSDFGETRLAEYANQEMAPIYDCHEYMDDAYEHLRSIELKHVAKSNYMSKQPDITFAMRSILIDWLVEVSEEYKLQQETIYLGVNYIDRFLSVMSVQRPKLQLVGSACMFIAAKYEEIYPPEVGEFVYITDDTYSKKQVLRMEHLVLKVLGFDLAVPTPLVFLNLFGRVTDCDTETLCLAQYLSELTLMDARVYLAYRASIIGAASVALARHTQGLAAWPKHVATMSSLEVDDFKDCLVDLHATFTNASSQGQQAIRELFLKTLTGSNSVIRQPPKVTSEQEAPPSYLPVTHDSLRLIEQAKTICEQRIYLDEAKELFSLISSKWLQAVLEIHDEVAAQIQNYCEGVEYIDGVSSIEEDDEDDDLKSRLSSLPEDKDGETKVEEEEEEVKVDTFRVIGVRRKAGQCLGLTVRLEGIRIKVARILIDSVIDRQGLLQTGDIILQANGKDVKNPEELQKAIEDSGEFIVFKIMPNPEESPTTETEPTKFGKDKFFVRAMFDYNPGGDNLLPCQDIGLPFRHGDIMEIVNWSDPSWWQARKVNSKERPGLVPSQDLEERRQCFVKNGFVAPTTCCGTTGRREKRKYEYHVRKNLDFDKAELMLYEAVEKMPPFSRKTLVLVSPQGLPKQSLIHKLVDSNPDMYGTTVPLTSRPMGDYEIDGESCWFVDHERMLDGLENNEFLDVGEHDNYLFGTTLESIRGVMSENKLCVLDVRPEALKLLHNSTEFLPFVIYLNPPPPDDYKALIYNGRASQNIELADSRAKRMAEESEQIKREFQKYFDLEFDYEDPESTLDKILGSLQKLMSETQWVPRNWVYS